MSQTKDIRDAVEGELGYDPLIDDSDISVKNINGDVALNGTVPSYPQYLEAAAAARRVALALRSCRTTSKSCCRPETTATTRR